MPAESYDLAVVGAGASGLMAAATAAQGGLSVVVLESQPLPCRKMCASSMGACALSNTAIDWHRFNGRDARFVSDALEAFPLAELVRWFDKQGVKLIKGPWYGLIVPEAGLKAAVLALVDAVIENGGDIRCEELVVSTEHTGHGFTLRTADGSLIDSAALVLACGGANYPQLGGGPTGYSLAQSLGHAVTEIHPAQVGLAITESWPRLLSGLWMDCDLRLLVDDRELKSATGSVLFTGSGLTGEAVFNVSRDVDPGRLNELEISFYPGRSRDEVDQLLFRTLGERVRSKATDALDHIIPRALGDQLLRNAKVKPGWRVDRLDKTQRGAILEQLVACRVTIAGTLGLRAAESARGGVNLREIAPRTMASRVVRNLYVTGSLLDVDGDWGGFEQHFALASGLLAGRAAATPE